MKGNYFYYIVFFAFENLVKCENRYELDIDNLFEYRREIVKRVKENLDFLTRHRSEAVRKKLERFISVNESMSLEYEKRLLEFFVENNNGLFGKDDQKIFLKKKIPYEDVAEVRFRAQEQTLRDTILAIFREAISFEALEVLGCTSLLEEMRKIVNIEKQVEEAYMGEDNNTNLQIINIGNFFVKGKLLGIVNRGYNHDWITDIILSDRIREDSTLFLDNMYIDDEFSNLYQKAIFDKEPLVFKSLTNYFDDIWDYLYKDDKDANEKVESILYTVFGEDDDFDEYQETDDMKVEKARFFFYLSYIDKLDELIDNGCEELSETRNRLLYALNYYDGGIKNKKYSKKILSELSNEDFNTIDFQDIYVMARIMLLDILDYANYDNLLKKVVFISTYYKLTHDNRISRILKAYQDPSLGIDFTNAIINNDFHVIMVIEKNQTKKKAKDKGE